MLREELNFIEAQRKTIDGFQLQLAEKKKQYNEVNKQLEDEATKGKSSMEEL
jgi:hypothetical protein